jgi:hypothetical protein
VTRVSAVAVAAALFLAAAPSAFARPSNSIDYRVVDLGYVIAFDVDLCAAGDTRVRFEADFKHGERAFTYHRWRGERQSSECARLFLGLRDTPTRFTRGAWEARLRIRFVDLNQVKTTRWRRFNVQ